MSTPVTPAPGNGSTPRVSATSLPVNPNPPAVATVPAGASALPANPTSNPATAAPARRQRRPPATPATAPQTRAAPSVELTQENLLDLGRLHVLAAKAGMAPQEFADDSRLLVTAWDRFQASLGK